MRLVRRLVLASMVAVGLPLAPATLLAREQFPHEFHRNMGYCAPFLAQERLPDGQPVRPWSNHLIHDLTKAGVFEGQRNAADLYSDRARSEADSNCHAR